MIDHNHVRRHQGLCSGLVALSNCDIRKDVLCGVVMGVCVGGWGGGNIPEHLYKTMTT